MKKGSIKNTRINSEVQKEIAVIVQNELHDPGIHPMTTVTNCEVTTDLQFCKVYFSVLSVDEAEKKKTLDGLNRAKNYIRKRLAETVNLRQTPEIQFVLDEGLEYGSYISDLICRVTAEDKKAEEKRKENAPDHEEI